MPPDSADQERFREITRVTRSFDIDVYEQSGCYTARDRWLRVPQYIVDHHDASTIASGEWGSLGYILSQRISNYQVARCLDGRPKLALIAAGANCPHAGVGGPWQSVPRDSMNGWGIGVEKAATLGERYTAAALYATQGLYYAIEQVCGRPHGSMVVEHEEWGNIGHPFRKSDSDYGYGRSTHGGPGGNGNWMRQQVAAFKPKGGASKKFNPMALGEDMIILSGAGPGPFGSNLCGILSGGIFCWEDPVAWKAHIEYEYGRGAHSVVWVDQWTWDNIDMQSKQIRRVQADGFTPVEEGDINIDEGALAKLIAGPVSDSVNENVTSEMEAAAERAVRKVAADAAQ